MRCKLMGYQPMNFVSKDTGELIVGVKLHLVSERIEDTDEMHGSRCSAIFTRLPLPKLELGESFELVYEMPLGSKVSRLVEVKVV